MTPGLQALAAPRPRLLALALLLAGGARLSAQGAPRRAAREHWVATWATALMPSAPRPTIADSDRVPTYANRTLREIVHVSIGGTRVRVRFSNEYGDRPLVVGAAYVALRDSGAVVRHGTDRALTFGGARSIVIRPGGVITSDGVALDVPALSDLAISVYLPDSSRASTVHVGAHQTSYVSVAGDESARDTVAVERTTTQWPFLGEVDVVNPRAAGVIVAFGNSITEGLRSTTDANARWPDVLARRLASGGAPIAVVDEAISGNRVLADGTGPSALSRFARDAIAVTGVSHVIVLEGINDILRGTNAPDSIDAVSADDVILGLRELADRAHEHGIRIVGATLTPIGGLGHVGPAAEAKVAAVNHWIRTSGVFDGVIDFDAATRDPAHPDRLLPRYDSGDHLHPGDAGYEAMGRAIDLALFRRR